MITFICAIFKPTTYTPEFTHHYDGSWVDKLYRGVKRNCTDPFIFIVLHDNEPYEILEEKVIKIPLLGLYKGWANLVECWRPELSDGPIFLLDLDTIITGDITHITRTKCELGLHRAGSRKICNGIGIFSREYADKLWYEWVKNSKYWIKHAKDRSGHVSELAYLRKFAAKDAIILNGMYPKQILSYKKHYLRRPGWRNKARIVIFHGNPKQHSINDKYLLSHWV